MTLDVCDNRVEVRMQEWFATRARYGMRAEGSQLLDSVFQ